MNNTSAVTPFNKDHSHRQKFPPPKGHEIPLASAKKARKRMRLELMNGETVTGRISQFDSYTITIYPETTDRPVTFFKHALLCFCVA